MPAEAPLTSPEPESGCARETPAEGATRPAPADPAPRVADTGSPRLAQRWPPAVRGARAAFIYFSRLRVGGFPYRASDWHWAPAHLPLVGAAVGAASAAVFAAAAWLGLGPLFGACLALATSLWLTGALHEDGLADSADGLAGGSDRARVLAIMKDSRIGTYGAAALMLTLLARAAAISELAPSAWFAIVAVHVAARVPPVWLLCALPYVNDRADARSQGLFQTRPLHVGVALGWSLLVGAAAIVFVRLSWPAALAVTLAPLALAPLLVRFFRRRLGGITGDLLGAAEQTGELAAWVAVTIALAA